MAVSSLKCPQAEAMWRPPVRDVASMVRATWMEGLLGGLRAVGKYGCGVRGNGSIDGVGQTHGRGEGTGSLGGSRRATPRTRYPSSLDRCMINCAVRDNGSQ